MARVAKPWYLKKTDWWYVWLDGQRVKLVKGKANRKAAADRLKELRTEAALNPGVDAAQTVASVIDRYLTHARGDLAKPTLAIRKLYLDSFVEAEGWRLVSDAKKIHLTEWVKAHPEWASDWTLNSIYSAIQRPFNWAVDQDIIAKNPFRGARHRPGAPRRPLTEDEFQKLLRASAGRGKKPSPGARFRQVLIFLYFTGARPGEASGLCWSDIDLERRVIVLKEHKTIRLQRIPKPRIIPLHPVVLKLLISIRRRNEGERVFLTYRKSPWNRNSLALRVRRAREKAGIPDDVKLYGIRHQFGTRAILNHVGIKTLSDLMGHTNVRMTEHYVHTASLFPEHLADAMLAVTSPRRNS
jgi:integrase